MSFIITVLRPGADKKLKERELGNGSNILLAESEEAKRIGLGINSHQIHFKSGSDKLRIAREADKHQLEPWGYFSYLAVGGDYIPIQDMLEKIFPEAKIMCIIS